MLARRSRRGAWSWLLALLLPVLLGFAALAVDTVYIQTGRIQAQGAADAAAQAAYVKFRVQRGLGDKDVAFAAGEYAGRHVASRNLVLGAPPDLMKITYGDWDGTAFTPRSAIDADAVQVALDRATDPPSFLFGTLLGYHRFTTPARATATGRPRAIVVAQDVTGSFIPALSYAEAADLAFLDFLIADAFPGDRVGMVLWQRATRAAPYTPMRTVRTDGAAIRTDWAKLVPDFNQPWLDPFRTAWCKHLGLTVGTSACNASIGTNQAVGLNKAVDMLLAETDPDAFRAIVLVSDGMPNYSSDYADSYAAAARAEANDIHIWTVAYEGTEGIDPTFMDALTTGRGRAYITPDPTDLPKILTEIAAEIPVILAQ